MSLIVIHTGAVCCDTEASLRLRLGAFRGLDARPHSKVYGRPVWMWRWRCVATSKRPEKLKQYLRYLNLVKEIIAEVAGR